MTCQLLFSRANIWVITQNVACEIFEFVGQQKYQNWKKRENAKGETILITKTVYHFFFLFGNVATDGHKTKHVCNFCLLFNRKMNPDSKKKQLSGGKCDGELLIVTPKWVENRKNTFRWFALTLLEPFGSMRKENYVGPEIISLSLLCN